MRGSMCREDERANRDIRPLRNEENSQSSRYCTPTTILSNSGIYSSSKTLSQSSPAIRERIARTYGSSTRRIRLGQWVLKYSDPRADADWDMKPAIVEPRSVSFGSSLDIKIPTVPLSSPLKNALNAALLLSPLLNISSTSPFPPSLLSPHIVRINFLNSTFSEDDEMDGRSSDGWMDLSGKDCREARRCEMAGR